MIVYDITRKATFEDIEKWKNEIMDKVRGSLKLMLIGNKCDLNDERKISTEKALEKAKLLNIPLMETSALDSTNIQKAFESILREMYKEFKKDKEKERKEKMKADGIKLDSNENQIEIVKPKENGGCC